MKRPLSESFLLVKTGGDLVDIRLRAILKISFDSKSDYSLLQIFLTTLFLRKFKINRGNLFTCLPIFIALSIIKRLISY